MKKRFCMKSSLLIFQDTLDLALNSLTRKTFSLLGKTLELIEIISNTLFSAKSILTLLESFSRVTQD